jgi:hypothetical protein
LSGFAFTLDVNLDGSTTVTNVSSQTSVGLTVSSVPEPSTFVLLLPLLLLIGFRIRSGSPQIP